MPISTKTPSNLKILVVDDDEDVVDVVCYFLETEGFNVTRAYDGEEALHLVTSDTDLVVLDIMLPGLDGFAVCKNLRARADTEDIPIVFLSAKVEQEDQIKGLLLGGDDYLTKPVTPLVLVAHIRAVLRRAGHGESRVVHSGELAIYEDEYRATLNDENLGLTLTEFQLLRYLVRHSGKAFRRTELLDTIWKDAMMVTERTVDAHIKNLREKLGPLACRVRTVRSIGYRYVPGAEMENGASK